jgi:hypothetical protein
MNLCGMYKFLHSMSLGTMVLVGHVTAADDVFWLFWVYGGGWMGQGGGGEVVGRNHHYLNVNI